MTTAATAVVQELFRDTGDGPRLLGSRCPACAAHYFPRAATCRRPACSGTEAEPVDLSPRGTIHSYTVQHYPAPAPFDVGDPFEPYAIVLVELPEGLRVAGILAGDPAGAAIGAPVELSVGPVRRDPEGTDQLTWKFELTEGVR